MAETPESLTIEQIEALVLSLYQPNKPDAIAETQAALTQLQSSQRAWSIARDLLARPDEKVKFHGALIIIIKLNSESSALTDRDATELLVNLVGWYLDSLSRANSPLVTRKLSSALATFLIHCHRLWGWYIHHLIICLASGQAHHPDFLSEMESSSSALESLGPVQIQAALSVVGNVVEDASKLDLNSERNAGLYNTVRQNTPDAVALMSKAMTLQAFAPQIHQDSISCLQSWIWFSQKASARDKFFVDSLRPLLTIVIRSLTMDSSVDASMELLSDVLSNFSSLLTAEHYDLLASILTSDWSQKRYQKLISGDFEFDSFQFAQLLLAFGDARVDSLMHSDDGRSQSLLSSMCGLLSVEGYPAVEDKVFVPAVEFWSTYAETLTDEIYSTESANSWAASAISYILQAVSHAWQRISFPPPEEFAQWDSSDRVSFNDARKDVADLLQSTYALSGPQLVFTFAELVVSSLSTTSWLRLEAAVFCLGSLADCVKEDTRCDEALFSVFSSSLFTTLRENRSDIPPRVQQTCVSLVEQYTEYFERNVTLLPTALNLLFALVGEQGLASPASKSIHRLCSSCRHHLFSEIDAFLDEYKRLVATRQLDCLSTEKILGGIACVSQGTPDELQRFEACGRILSFVEEDARRSVELTRSSPQTTEFLCDTGSRCVDDSDIENPALHMGVRALKCLASISRGFQSLNDAPIDIEDTGRRKWEPRPELSELHKRIFSIILRVQTTFPNSSEVMETICSVLRSGFSENDPGPFVFPPGDIAQFLTEYTVQIPRIGAVVSTACSFVSSIEHHDDPLYKEQLLSKILLWVIGLTRNLPDPESDPELTHNAIDFSSRLITKNPLALLQLQPPEATEFFFMFTLNVLDGKEPLPKAASADFWVSFMNLQNGTSELQEASLHVMNTLGPLLCRSLARNIGGNASRSELDKLSEPLKKLVSRYPSAKSWIESGLNDPSFPSSKITLEQKSLFVKKLLSLRGSRATNQLVFQCHSIWYRTSGELMVTR